MSAPRFTNKLHNRKVLIVGGTTGVGLSIATAVLEFGGIAIVSSSSTARVESAISSLKASYPDAADRVYGTTIDLSTTDDLDARTLALLEYAKSAHNGALIDHIAFTAGDVVPITPVATATDDMIEKLLQVRVKGAIFLAKHALDYFVPSTTSSFTLTTGSSLAKPAPGWALVAGLIGTSQVGLARGFAVEFAPIRANLVVIGMTDTDILEKIGVTGEIKEKMKAQTLTKKIGRPDDVAEAYLYVMRDANVTGQVITTDGGSLLA